jgi:hypothetical protein
MKRMLHALRADFARRPWWMNALFYFCVYMTVLYLPFDFLLKPVAKDHEIWFGVALVGWWAKATEPLHWAIYAAGAYGFWKMKAWMWPWAAVYAGQVALAMLVWNVINVNGRGWLAGGLTAAVFAAPMIALWRARPLFTGPPTSPGAAPAG